MTEKAKSKDRSKKPEPSPNVVIREGRVTKLVGPNEWTDRYCVLKDVLYVWKTRSDYRDGNPAELTIRVAGRTVENVDSVSPTGFQLSHPFQGDREVYIFGALTANDRNEWLEALDLAHCPLRSANPIAQEKARYLGEPLLVDLIASKDTRGKRLLMLTQNYFVEFRSTEPNGDFVAYPIEGASVMAPAKSDSKQLAVMCEALSATNEHRRLLVEFDQAATRSAWAKAVENAAREAASHAQSLVPVIDVSKRAPAFSLQASVEGAKVYTASNDQSALGVSVSVSAFEKTWTVVRFYPEWVYLWQELTAAFPLFVFPQLPRDPAACAQPDLVLRCFLREILSRDTVAASFPVLSFLEVRSLHRAVLHDSVPHLRWALDAASMRADEGSPASIEALTSPAPESMLPHRVAPFARCSPQGTTALHLAVYLGHRATTEVLLSHGADTLVAGTRGKGASTCLHTAAARGFQELVTLLVSVVEVDAPDGTGQTPLHLAAAGNHKAAAVSLLVAGAGVNAVDEKGNTPLHTAAGARAEQVALLLLQQVGVRPHALNAAGQSHVHLAATHGLLRVVVETLNTGLNPNVCEAEGNTPLLLATMNGHALLARQITRYDGSPVWRNNDGNTAHHYAAMMRRKEDSAALFQSFYECDNPPTPLVSLINAHHYTPLHCAAYADNDAYVSELLFADRRLASSRDARGLTALHVACARGSLAAARAIVEAAKFTLRDKDGQGQTALHIAAWGRYPSLVAYLLNAGALALELDEVPRRTKAFELPSGFPGVPDTPTEATRLNPIANGCLSPLHISALQGDVESLRAFTATQRLDVLSINKVNYTAAHLAAMYGHAAAVKLIVDYAGDAAEAILSAQDEDKRTPLHLATISNHGAVASWLCLHGSSLETVDAHGNTPLFYAAGELSSTLIALREASASLSKQSLEATGGKRSSLRIGSEATLDLPEKGKKKEKEKEKAKQKEKAKEKDKAKAKDKGKQKAGAATPAIAPVGTPDATSATLSDLFPSPKPHARGEEQWSDDDKRPIKRVGSFNKRKISGEASRYSSRAENSLSLSSSDERSGRE